MKLATTALLALGMLFAISACKKNNSQAQPTVYPNYAALKVGNYWVYQEYMLDFSGYDTATNVWDSCYVVKDTVINAKTYMVLAGPATNYSGNTVYQYLRDSLDFIVDQMGTIVFSSGHPGITFTSFGNANDTFSYQMSSLPVAVTVSAGSYSTLDFTETIKGVSPFPYYGSTRYRHTRYAQNVGIVTLTLQFYQSQPNYIERRLVRYHLN
jgi:hypothetical protein